MAMHQRCIPGRDCHVEYTYVFIFKNQVMTRFGGDFHRLLWLRQSGCGQKQQARDAGRSHIKIVKQPDAPARGFFFLSLRSKPLKVLSRLECLLRLLRAARRHSGLAASFMSLRSKPLVRFRSAKRYFALMLAARRARPRRPYLQFLSLRSKPLKVLSRLECLLPLLRAARRRTGLA